MTARTTPRATGTMVRGADAELVEFPGGSSIRLYAEGIGPDSAVTVHSAILRNGVDGASPHHHRTTTELIYVLAGSMQVLVGDQVVSAAGGDLIVIPPGVTHAFGAAAGQDAEILDVISPGVERFGHFRRLSLAARGLAGPDAVLEAQPAHDAFTDDSPAWNQARQEETTP